MTEEAKALIEIAIKEDWGDGDHTSLASINRNQRNKAKLLAKAEGVVAGIDVARYVFNRIDSSANFKLNKKDGDTIATGDIIFEVELNTQKLLQAERLALNFMQRMSGIATRTAAYVKETEGTKAKILDTRKTTPGVRFFEKKAVEIGGGFNHRYGLYDRIMLKDNHIDYAGGIKAAVEGVQAYLRENNKSLPVEVETRNIEEIKAVLDIGGVDRIMLDNFSIEATKEAVALIGDRAETESSGGITLETVRSYALCGVDFISVGALTHQIQSLDLSLKAVG